MMLLDKALLAWGTPDFEVVLKHEIARLGAPHLPLHQGLSTGNHVAEGAITVTIISVAEMDNAIRVKAGIFYRSVHGGCSCGGDPVTASEIDEYCEVQIDIDKVAATTTVFLVAGEAD